MDEANDLSRKGEELIEELKRHIVKTLAQDPSGQHGGEGLGNVEIEHLSGLEIPLDRPPGKSQEHWLTWTIVQRLVADGIVEVVHSPKTRYRLATK